MRDNRYSHRASRDISVIEWDSIHPDRPSTSGPMQQTTTPYKLSSLPDKRTVSAQFLGKPLAALRTPALVIDRAVFTANCANMHRKAQEWATSFRAHVKSHKVSSQVLSNGNNNCKLLLDADGGGNETTVKVQCRHHDCGGGVNAYGSVDDFGCWTCRGWYSHGCVFRPERLSPAFSQ
jgi:hypothetical protein